MPAPETEPAIQCSTGPFWAFPLEAAFDAIAEAGFSAVELMITRDPATQRPGLPARLAEERGLRIASVHGPFLVVTKGVWGVDPLDKIRRGLEMCRALGASCYVVHPPHLWESGYAHWVVTRSGAVARETGVAIAVETMYPRWVGHRRLRGYRWSEPWELLVAADRVVMDTSHLTVARQDVLAAYALLRPKIAHIHLSNNAGDGRDGHQDLEEGVVPVDILLEELRRTAYAGSIALELSVRGYLERSGPLVEALRRNRQYVLERMGPRPQRELRRP
jgi:sugar phosphate isomerase/epimerase